MGPSPAPSKRSATAASPAPSTRATKALSKATSAEAERNSQQGTGSQSPRPSALRSSTNIWGKGAASTYSVRRLSNSSAKEPCNMPSFSQASSTDTSSR
eukprot:CAMPEP_0117540718 /NCGR_PEP_ID=MMETSP0784-20121206/43643_1 /TAXON_ID=39447 /ORGANISM="" /LENGTH=98 /DNA_ID=CAMNT_0005337381 /DNA_START=140 /DNA_END=436 /DNA_ORIENTATION=+